MRQVKGLSDAPVQSKRPPALQQQQHGPPPLKKARGGTPTLPVKPSPLATSHLANRLTQPRSQPVQAVQAKPDVEPTESESQDSWSVHHDDLDASGDGEEMKVYPDTELQTDDDQIAQDQVSDCQDIFRSLGWPMNILELRNRIILPVCFWVRVYPVHTQGNI